jgi:hypothetical protein
MIEPLPNKINISFSSKAKINQGPLTERIQDYEGGSTNIQAGFTALNMQLKTNCPTKNVTVIFVSDGGDDNQATIEKRLEEETRIQIDLKKSINFMTIGVGSGFPTFLSMKLRAMYHNGQSDLPPVFLVDTSSDAPLHFQEQFNMLQPFLAQQEKAQSI